MDINQALGQVINSPLAGALVLGILIVVFLIGLLALIRTIITLFQNENRQLLEQLHTMLEELHTMNGSIQEMLGQEQRRIAMRQNDLDTTNRQIASLIQSQDDIKTNSNNLASSIVFQIPKAVWESEPGQELITTLKRIADKQVGT